MEINEIIEKGHTSAVPYTAALEYEDDKVNFFAEIYFTKYFLRYDITIHVEGFSFTADHFKEVKCYLEEKAREALENESKE